MIVELLPAETILFLKNIESLGFSLCLMGGFTRDYFFNKKIGNDFDFEIRPSHDHLDNITQENWPIFYQKLNHYFIEKKIAYEELPYLITRVKLGLDNFEFSSPRVEIDIQGNYGHHHFDAILDPLLTYEVSFKRRDLTINSIGLELILNPTPVSKIIDPYNGLEDLKNGVLRNITEDFFLDSVRFLRLIRFKIKFESFAIDEHLYSKLSQFNLTQLSPHYFKEEFEKSFSGEFLNLFSHLVIFKKIKIPENFLFWTRYLFPKSCMTKEDLLAFVLLQNENDAELLSDFFSMSDKKIKNLKSFKTSYDYIAEKKKQEFIDILSLPFEDALRHPILKELKNLEEKKEWKIMLNFITGHKKILIDWKDWSQVSVNEAEINSITPSLRSYYLYYKTIKKMYSND